VPLREDESYAGRRDDYRAILWFLRRNFDLAYTAEEVMFELGSLEIVLTLADVEENFKSLLERERAESRTVRGAVYFKYDRRFGFRPPR
jgi:hypothetical protein